jgi:hypothetical protein
MSLNKMMTSTKLNDIDTEKVQRSEAARDQRRRSSLLRMGVTEGVRSVVWTALSSAVADGALEGTSVEKLQKLLTAAKERGMRYDLLNVASVWQVP